MNSTLGKLSGHLRIVCSADAEGRSHLSRQSFRAPLHLSKAYWDGDVLLVNVVNPTAGLFAGDEIEVDVSVASGAKLLLTTPSASRAHAMPAGIARVRQQFTVETGAWLEVCPELFIPQADCRYEQRTEIDVAAGGELFFVETLSPGRVARGECFGFSELKWALDVRHEGLALVRERFCVRRDDDSLHALNHPFANGYAASCYLVSDRVDANHPCWDAVRNLHGDNMWIGVSRLVQSGWMIKILARDSVFLRKGLHSLRGILSEVFPALRVSSRKL